MIDFYSILISAMPIGSPFLIILLALNIRYLVCIGEK